MYKKNSVSCLTLDYDWAEIYSTHSGWPDSLTPVFSFPVSGKKGEDGDLICALSR
jgi:hypothetical protein